MMHPTLLALKTELKSYINELYNDHKDQIIDCADIIIHQTTAKLLEYKHIFNSIESPTKYDEIYYFKHIKTKLLAIIYLCHYIKTIEANKPAIKRCKLKKYYLKELIKVKNAIQELDYYYSYYRAEVTHSDEKFFLRIDTDIFRNISNVILEIDSKSSTPYISIFSRAEALFNLKQYLKEKINSYNTESKEPSTTKSPLHWTASKTDLTELVYALYAAGVFNNGKATIKEIVEALQQSFNVDIGQHTRTFYDIKLRKKLKTKHIDQLRESLLRKINDTDFDLFTE